MTRAPFHDVYGDALVPRELLESVVAFYAPRKVILFGSRARGDHGPDSDIDLLVVVDDDTPAEKFSAESVYASRRGFNQAVDILPMVERRYERKRTVVGSLADTADFEGVVVYERR